MNVVQVSLVLLAGAVGAHTNVVVDWSAARDVAQEHRAMLVDQMALALSEAGNPADSNTPIRAVFRPVDDVHPRQTVRFEVRSAQRSEDVEFCYPPRKLLKYYRDYSAADRAERAGKEVEERILVENGKSTNDSEYVHIADRHAQHACAKAEARARQVARGGGGVRP